MKQGNWVSDHSHSLRFIKTRLNNRSLTFLLTRGLEYTLLQSNLTCDLYWKIAKKLYRSVYDFEVDSYDTEINPLETYSVDPSLISRLTGRHNANSRRWDEFGNVQSGDWDQGPGDDWHVGLDSPEFDKTTHHKSMVDHFEDGVSWEETQVFNKILDKIQNNQEYNWHGCRNRDELSRRFEYVDQLYSSIKNEGYQSQFDMNRCHPDIDNFGVLDLLLNEITVDVSRGGDLLFVDGRHRLSICKILNLESIPVTVVVRHKQWMEKLARNIEI